MLGLSVSLKPIGIAVGLAPAIPRDDVLIVAKLDRLSPQRA